MLSLSVSYPPMFRNSETLEEREMIMMRLLKRTRLILGIAAVLASVLLSWGLTSFLDDMSLLIVLLGGAIFVWLNPELMRGE